MKTSVRSLAACDGTGKGAIENLDARAAELLSVFSGAYVELVVKKINAAVNDTRH